jgi:Mrp family chromosome partitioning ATPase
MPAGLRSEFARAAAILARAAEGAAPSAVVVMGAATGEGVTTCTAHLACQLAGPLGLRVLLVDLAGGRAPLRDALARLADPPAMLAPDAVAGSAAALALVAVAPGAADDVPAQRRRLDGLIVAAGIARFDVVLVDAPAPETGLLAMTAARCCGQALLVIRAGNLPSETIERVRDDLAQAGVGILGAIVNQRREVVPAWIDRLLR